MATRVPELRLRPEVEAAIFLGVKRQTLRNWRYRGVGPPYLKLEGAIRYAESDLEAYLEGCRVRRPKQMVIR